MPPGRHPRTNEKSLPVSPEGSFSLLRIKRVHNPADREHRDSTRLRAESGRSLAHKMHRDSSRCLGSVSSYQPSNASEPLTPGLRGPYVGNEIAPLESRPRRITRDIPGKDNYGNTLDIHGNTMVQRERRTTSPVSPLPTLRRDIRAFYPFNSCLSSALSSLICKQLAMPLSVHTLA